MIKTFGRAYERLLWLMMAAAAVYVGLMMVAIIYYTTFRTLGWYYTPFAFVFVEYGFIYVLMLGGPWLVRTKSHVYIELLTAAVPDSVRNVLSRFVALICAAICLVLAWYTGALAVEHFAETKYDELRAQLNILRWITTVSMPVGFGLMGIEFLPFVFGRELLHSGKAGVAGEG